LFYSLRLNTKATQGTDHLVGVTGIAAEPVPFGKQDQIGFFSLFLRKSTNSLDHLGRTNVLAE